MLLDEIALKKTNIMNTLQTTTIYQTEDSQLKLHFIQDNDSVVHYFECITPNGIFIDDDFLISNMYMIKSMDATLSQLRNLNLD